jgi:predicted nucleotidyltransferase
MLTEHEKNVILTCARKYGVSSILLFGSSAEVGREPADIDLAVRGIDKRLFFKFYAELVKNLDRPVDLVDLSRKSLFNDIVEETGVILYG